MTPERTMTRHTTCSGDHARPVDGAMGRTDGAGCSPCREGDAVHPFEEASGPGSPAHPPSSETRRITRSGEAHPPSERRSRCFCALERAARSDPAHTCAPHTHFGRGRTRSSTDLRAAHTVRPPSSPPPGRPTAAAHKPATTEPALPRDRRPAHTGVPSREVLREQGAAYPDLVAGVCVTRWSVHGRVRRAPECVRDARVGVRTSAPTDGVCA
jgi:hypothetical protein